jgi:crotonobetainyl-CoA:carnitine CoA-transferase CaiB-like acyl-CoA transferase
MQAELPLNGIIVLDLGQIYNGPYATLLMAMAGARVIKVESLRGEASRSQASYPFASLNSNKESITLNLKTDKGKELFKDLVREVDVVLENYAPDTMDNLGLGAESLLEINPGLVYAAGSGYGRSGEHRDYLAMDVTVQAMSGIMSTTGEEGMPPMKAGAAPCDFAGGMNLYGAVVSALLRKFRTGKGAIIDVAMQDSVVPMLTSSFSAYYHGNRTPPARTGNRHAALALAPYNVYPAADGHVALICNREAHWRALARAIGREELIDDPRFKGARNRAKIIDLVDDLIGEWTHQRTRVEILDILQSCGVPSAMVRDIDEVLHDEHLHQRGMLEYLEHPVLGTLAVPTTPLKFVGEELPELRRYPELGEHNRSVYSSLLGIEDSTLDSLKEEGII